MTGCLAIPVAAIRRAFGHRVVSVLRPLPFQSLVHRTIGPQTKLKPLLGFAGNWRLAEAPVVRVSLSHANPEDAVAVPVADEWSISRFTESKVVVGSTCVVLIAKQPRVATNYTDSVCSVAVPIAHDGGVAGPAELERDCFRRGLATE